MLGDSDSVQFTRELIHGFSKQRPEMNASERRGLYSPAAEAHLRGPVLAGHPAPERVGIAAWGAGGHVDRGGIGAACGHGVGVRGTGWSLEWHRGEVGEAPLDAVRWLLR
jgi:hypothetical protein